MVPLHFYFCNFLLVILNKMYNLTWHELSIVLQQVLAKREDFWAHYSREYEEEQEKSMWFFSVKHAIVNHLTAHLHTNTFIAHTTKYI